MTRLTRDGPAERISRDQVLRRERGQRTNHFPRLANHEHRIGNLAYYTVDPYTAESAANLCVSFFLFFVLCFFSASAWHRKPPQVYSSVVYTPRHAKTSSHSHPQKQSLGLRHNKALACIPPARSWLLLRVMASRAREGCQPVRQTVLFLILLQKMGPLGTFLVASRKHRPHHSIHLYTPRPDYIYIAKTTFLIHTTHKNKALASDTTKP